jgi:hypothetical protein
MNRTYAESRFSSAYVEDLKEGFAGMELHRSCGGDHCRVARILYWDACGQFFVETFDFDVPLEIIEELIREAKERISIR